MYHHLMPLHDLKAMPVMLALGRPEFESCRSDISPGERRRSRHLRIHPISKR